MLFRIPIPSSIAGKSFKLIGPTCESEAEALYFTNFLLSVSCVGGLVVRALVFCYIHVSYSEVGCSSLDCDFFPRLRVRGNVAIFFFFFGCSRAGPID